MTESTNPNLWTKQDSTAARAQGWDVFEIWDGRVQYEIQKDDQSDIFKTDEAARAFVHTRNNSDRDALCHKAWSIVFKSKVALPTKGKKK